MDWLDSRERQGASMLDIISDINTEFDNGQTSVEDLQFACTGGFSPLPTDVLHSDDFLWFNNTGLDSSDEIKCEDKNVTYIPGCNSSGTPFAATSSDSKQGSGKAGRLMSESPGLQIGGCMSDRHAAESDLSNSGKRPYSLGDSNSKNAIAARDNRQRKKKYISGLEESVRNLQTENEHLRDQCRKNRNTVSRLQNEVSYLQGVIANQSALSAVLENVMKTPGIKFSMSLKSAGQKDNTQMKESQEPDDGSHNCGHFPNKLDKNHVGSSSMQSPFGLVNSLPSQKMASEVPRRNLKCRAERKKPQPHQKIRIQSVRDQEESATIDVENFEDSDSSAASVSEDGVTSQVAGICLHVLGQNVSLEFCSHCNASAHSRISSDHSYVKL